MDHHWKATYRTVEKPKIVLLPKTLQGCGRTISDYGEEKAPTETCRKGIQNRLWWQEISVFWKAVPSTCKTTVETRETSWQ